MFLVKTSSIEGYETLVRAAGHDPAALLSQAGLSIRQLRAPNTYCAYIAVAEALDRAAAACDEPLFGLKLTSIQSPVVFGDLVLTASQQPTLERAMATANRFLGVLAGGISVNIEYVGERMLFKFRSAICEQNGCLQKVQLSIGLLGMFVSKLLGLEQPSFPLCLRQSRPLHTQLPAPLLSRIQFDAPFDGITIPISWRYKQPHRDERAIRLHLESSLRELQSRHAENFNDQVRTIIGNLLPLSECTVANVARTLNLSKRGLQQRLSREGLTFGELLADVRLSIAQQHLQVANTPITELALNLGYAEVSVFSRQFKKWTGLAPKQYRQQLLAAGG